MLINQLEEKEVRRARLKRIRIPRNHEPNFLSGYYQQIFQRMQERIQGRYNYMMSMRPREGSYRQRLERRLHPYAYRPFYAIPPVFNRATGYMPHLDV